MDKQFGTPGMKDGVWWRTGYYHHKHGRVVTRNIKTGRFIKHEAAHIAFAVFGLHCGISLEVI